MEKENVATRDLMTDDVMNLSKGGPIKKSCLKNVASGTTKRKGTEMPIGMCSVFRLIS